MLYIQVPGGISLHVNIVGVNSVKNSTYKYFLMTSVRKRRISELNKSNQW